MVSVLVVVPTIVTRAGARREPARFVARAFLNAERAARLINLESASPLETRQKELMQHTGTPNEAASPGIAGHPEANPGERTLASDILYGAEEIAAFLFGSKRSRRAVYNLIETKSIPHFRIGTGLCARKSVLLAWIAEQEGESKR